MSAHRADVILRSARGQSVREITGAFGYGTSRVQLDQSFPANTLSGLVAQARANGAPLEAKSPAVQVGLSHDRDEGLHPLQTRYGSRVSEILFLNMFSPAIVAKRSNSS
jgi:hypothetical protein